MAYKYENLKELHRGRIAKRDRGGKSGGTPFHRKYGFRMVDVQGKKEYVPIPEEQDVIRRVRGLRDEGRTYVEIAGTLNEEGIPTSTGGSWSRKTIRDLCVQPGRQPKVEAVTGVRYPVPDALPDEARRTA